MRQDKDRAISPKDLPKMPAFPTEFLEGVHRSVYDTYREHWKEDPVAAGRSLAFVLNRVEGFFMGRREILREDTLADLAERFGSVPADVTDRVNALTDEPRLRALRKLALTAPTFDAFLVELVADAR